MNDLSKHIAAEPFKMIAGLCQSMQVDAYVIGGYVRDLLLKRPSKDIDIVVVGSGIEVAREVAAKIGKGADAKFYGQFGTAMIRYKSCDIEFVGARKESYKLYSRKPIVEDGTLADDQKRRDFTINALAISLNSKDYGRLVDPFNGLADLKAKILRIFYTNSAIGEFFIGFNK